jgi:cupin 2 domain-containing protein
MSTVIPGTFSRGLAVDNLFAAIPPEIPQEIFQVLLETNHFRLERIISAGQATAPGEWYDQDDHEWVVLLTGAAGLRFEDEPEPRVLGPGDHLLIPAHRRHRVEWTDPEAPTVWLALHYRQLAVSS